MEATFESLLQLPGNDEVNDATTEDGFVAVEPGDRIPGIPRQSVKAGILQGITTTWDVAVEIVSGSSRIFLGDEGNDQAPLDGYGIVNLRSAYRLSPASSSSGASTTCWTPATRRSACWPSSKSSSQKSPMRATRASWAPVPHGACSVGFACGIERSRRKGGNPRPMLTAHRRHHGRWPALTCV